MKGRLAGRVCRVPPRAFLDCLVFNKRFLPRTFSFQPLFVEYFAAKLLRVMLEEFSKSELALPAGSLEKVHGPTAEVVKDAKQRVADVPRQVCVFATNLGLEHWPTFAGLLLDFVYIYIWTALTKPYSKNIDKRKLFRL